MVLYGSIALIVVFISFGIIFPESLATVTNILYSVIAEYFGWFYLLAILVILIFCFIIGFSRYGKIRLGDDDDRPEHSNFSWFAMLFCAGMGIGLLFWSVAEPASHFLSPPPGTVGGTQEAAMVAIKHTFLHWGLHPWAIYAILGLGVAYSTFRKKRPLLISSIFNPILKGNTTGGIGKSIDIFSLILTAIGVATSLGLGVLQVNGGLEKLFGITESLTVQIILIAVITVLFLIDAVTGIDKGIRVISNFNLVIAIGLVVFVFLVGPTATILKTLVSGLGGYITDFFRMSLHLSPFTDDSWVKAWTVFYWAWWITWAPFVGTFIARISKGRTIREFVLGVLLLPTGFSLIWFAAFGGTVLDMELNKGITDIATTVSTNLNTGLFEVFSHLPGGYIASLFAMVLVITFFITSADSATFVIAMFSRGGSLNPDNKIKVIWGIFLGLIAIVLLLSGGLQAIQTTAIVISLPYTFILLLIGYVMYIELRNEEKLL